MLHRAASKGVLMCHTQTIKVPLRGAEVTPCKSVWTNNLGKPVPAAWQMTDILKLLCLERKWHYHIITVLGVIMKAIRLLSGWVVGRLWSTKAPFTPFSGGWCSGGGGGVVWDPINLINCSPQYNASQQSLHWEHATSKDNNTVEHTCFSCSKWQWYQRLSSRPCFIL